MMYLIFYDIKSDSLRTKIAKRFIARGYERLQYSVYAAIENPAQDQLLWNEFTAILNEEQTAKLYVIPVLKKNFRKIKIIGTFGYDLDYLVGEKRSLTF